LVRAFGEPQFTTSETELLDALLPPLQRVLEVQNQLDLLSLAEDIAQTHCQRLGHGVLSIGDDGHVQYLNRVAEELLEKNAAHLSLDGGELRIAHPESGKRFETLVRQCVVTAGSRYVRSGGALAVPRDGHMPLAITVYPSRRDANSSNVINRGARATVILHDPEHPRADSRAMLREMYGLSAAEAEVCWRLANGQSLADIAKDTHASAETVRSQLKRVFGKTGTNRQADVVRLVLLGPMSIS
jgi:DNA-binding CsgD family transcriptional regulator